MYGYVPTLHVRGPASEVTPAGFAMTHDVADITSTIGKTPLLPGLLDPLSVSHEPMSFEPRSVSPVIVSHGELTGVPLVAGTQTPPTFCPGDAYDPTAAVDVAAADPIRSDVGTERHVEDEPRAPRDTLAVPVEVARHHRRLRREAPRERDTRRVHVDHVPRRHRGVRAAYDRRLGQHLRLVRVRPEQVRLELLHHRDAGAGQRPRIEGALETRDEGIVGLARALHKSAGRARGTGAGSRHLARATGS